MGFKVEYVKRGNGTAPAKDFIDGQDAQAQAAMVAGIEALEEHGPRLPGGKTKKLTKHLFELKVKQNKREFRILYFCAPKVRRLIVLTSGFVKKTQKTPKGEIATAERLRKWWMEG